MLRLRDARAFLSALEAQFALVVTLMQVADVRLFRRAFEWSPDAIVRRGLCAVRSQSELRIGAEKRGDLFGLHLVHVVGIGFHSRIVRFELCLHLVPVERLLRAY